MRRFLTHSYVVLIARWVLGLLFIASALGKILDPAAFADNIAAYRMMPQVTIRPRGFYKHWGYHGYIISAYII